MSAHSAKGCLVSSILRTQTSIAGCGTRRPPPHGSLATKGRTKGVYGHFYKCDDRIVRFRYLDPGDETDEANMGKSAVIARQAEVRRGADSASYACTTITEIMRG